jgi:hypothetical protein
MLEAMKIYRNPANAIIAALGPYLRRDGTDAGMTGDLQLNGNDILMAGGNVLLGAGGIGNDSQVLTFATLAAGELATFTAGITADGNISIIGTATNRIMLPQNNDAANPTLTIGGSGFYERAASSLAVSIGGASEARFDIGGIRSEIGGGFRCANVAADATTSTLNPSNQDGDTGLCWPGADILGFLCGGVLGAHVREDTNILEFKTFGSQIVKVTDVNATPYTVLQTDYYLQCRRTGTGVLTVNLPAISTVGDGFVLIIKDSGYNANAFNITVVRNGADTINNVGGNYTINVDGTALVLIANDTTDDWEIF